MGRRRGGRYMLVVRKNHNDVLGVLVEPLGTDGSGELKLFGDTFRGGLRLRVVFVEDGGGAEGSAGALRAVGGGGLVGPAGIAEFIAGAASITFAGSVVEDDDAHGSLVDLHRLILLLLFLGGSFVLGDGGAGGGGIGADMYLVATIVDQHEDADDGADQCGGNQYHGECPVREAGGVALNVVLGALVHISHAASLAVIRGGRTLTARFDLKISADTGGYTLFPRW